MAEDKLPSVLDLLQQICDIMEEKDLAEVYLREGGMTLRVRRDNDSEASRFPYPPYAAPSSATEQNASPISASSAQLQKNAGEIITSPMLGLFYQSPSPEAPPYIEVGSIVSVEDTLCLIEAMKIFNEVKPDFPCEILEILVENATPVEFDQPLFRVRKI